MTDVTAIILCGGKGERLRPFTDSLPKALVPLNGSPLLFHLLRYLSVSGINRFVLCTGYRAEAIEEAVDHHGDSGWDIVCVNSGDAGMTDRLMDARKYVDGRSLVCYGDTLANVRIEELVDAHEKNGAKATITTYPLRSPFGIVEIDSAGRVREFA